MPRCLSNPLVHGRNSPVNGPTVPPAGPFHARPLLPRVQPRRRTISAIFVLPQVTLNLRRNTFGPFRSSGGRTGRLAVACGQRIASCGQENAPKPAPASQNHAFGQEIAGKRARKVGPSANRIVSCKLDAPLSAVAGGVTMAVIGHKGCAEEGLSLRLPSVSFQGPGIAEFCKFFHIFVDTEKTQACQTV